jgi:serine/threonine protein phosphatase PrpC
MSPWFVAGASARGTAHVQTDTPCQDSLGYEVVDDCLVMVLADGAGSAPHSREGAQRAVAAAIGALTGELHRHVPVAASGWKPLMVSVVAGARSALVEAAPAASLSDYATTLTCAVAAGPRHVVIAHIGDAMVAIQRQSGEMFTCMPPQRAGEYVNQTRFLTDDDALDQVDIRYLPIPARAVMAVTDGLLPVVTDRYGEPFPPFWVPMIGRVEQAVRDLQPETIVDEITTLLESDRICAHVDDDKTLVVATRTEDSDRG